MLIDTEADVLSNLVSAALGRSQMGAEMLLSELERAETCDRADVPADVVTMMSRVVFVDEASAEKHAVQVVYPRNADSALQRISVLTPIGAALIGMRKGAAIDWPNRAGEYRRLRILEVVQPPVRD
jgi:regulator of nucleoside diphosphate kinase